MVPMGAAHGTIVLVCVMAGVGLALTILVFYPGYLTRDATFVRGYVENWYLGDWQSPLMTIVWRLIDPISPGTGSIFLLMATLYWLGFAMAALAVARRSGGLAIAVLLLALVPPAFMLLAMIWRDILFGAAWLLAAAIIYFVADRSGSSYWAVRGLALVLVGFGILLRPNAIIAAPLLIAYVAWPACFEWKRAALSGADETEGEKRQARNAFTIQRGKEAVETGGVLAGFGDDCDRRAACHALFRVKIVG